MINVNSNILMIKLRDTMACKGFVSLLIVLSIVISTSPISAQIKERADKMTFLKGDNAFEYGDYTTAYKLYKSIYHLDPTNIELNYRLGICAFNIKKLKKESINYFKKTSPTVYPKSLYYVACLNHLNRNYNAAISKLNKYKKVISKNKEEVAIVEQKIANCITARYFESLPSNNIQILSSGENINTIHDEYVPLIPKDESFMVFTSRRPNEIHHEKDAAQEYFEDIYTVKANSNKTWGSPMLLDKNGTINTATHDASTALSTDGKHLLIYRTDESIVRGNIYESINKNGTWGAPQKLNENVNSEEYTETSACYSADRKMIFFSSNRPGGYGGKDIYRSIRLPNGNWGTPYNLGPSVNTKYDDDAPYIHPYDKTLYFSSKGHENMGGYDVFSATINETGQCSNVKNLGYPINTVNDDIFFIVNSSNTTGYLSSNRAGGKGGYDIYTIKFDQNSDPPNIFNVFFIDNITKKVIPNVTMEAVELQSNKLYGSFRTDKRNGKLLFISEPSKEYKITVRADGYRSFMTTTIFAANNKKKTFTLKK